MRKNFKIILTALAALSLLILTFAIYSCCEDCPIGPVQSRPYKGWLYATNIQNNWVYKIDTEIDSLVDSINSGIDPSYTPGSIDVSQDGHYLAVPYYSIPLNDKFVRIYDAQSLEIIIDIADYFFPIFITGENILLAIRNGVHIYSLPDFTLLSSDSIGPSLFPVLYEKKHLVYILSMVGYTNTDSTFLYAYDYKQRKKVGQWFFSDSKDSL
ncbi:MAG: hypothetical protein GWO41_07035, partial [candidate division Zixibacteria bacterium]|nr:hypothetical protein [candidate division Zixibacteria bacterium]NIR62939.1 hypothetical protein [candidate division Zixibacteria bacterium]NIS16829.1 hypothetical protein [candidate division Zixibacteria bacterium]NIS44949.1 hypothetical protein [candidate division Zixibacteria bacterium]NIT52483.1 hypothetical protein [candidate division Zixibacteria bacterium]